MSQIGSFIFYKDEKMKLLMEIRPGEGGEDAKLLVEKQAAIYIRFAEKNGCFVEIEERGHL